MSAFHMNLMLTEKNVFKNNALCGGKPRRFLAPRVVHYFSIHAHLVVDYPLLMLRHSRACLNNAHLSSQSESSIHPGHGITTNNTSPANQNRVFTWAMV